MTKHRRPCKPYNDVMARDIIVSPELVTLQYGLCLFGQHDTTSNFSAGVYAKHWVTFPQPQGENFAVSARSVHTRRNIIRCEFGRCKRITQPTNEIIYEARNHHILNPRSGSFPSLFLP